MNEEIKKELPKAWWRRTLPIKNLDTGELLPPSSEKNWIFSVREDLERYTEQIRSEAIREFAEDLEDRNKWMFRGYTEGTYRKVAEQFLQEGNNEQ